MAWSLDTGDGRTCALDCLAHRAAPVALFSCQRYRVVIAAKTALRAFAGSPWRRGGAP